MISHKHKWIFVHLVKCGGTSIENIFWKTGGDLICKKEYVDTTKHVKHVTARQYSTTTYWSDYFTFTFVRNPWDKMVSFYEYFKKIRKQPHVEFLDFLEEKHWLPMFTNQLDLLTPHPGEPEIDYIGRFETLQQDFNVVCDKIGIPQQQLPHKNKTSHRPYTEYYDEETKQIVAERFAKDIECFGYKFGE